MKRNIITALALGALSLTAAAQYKVVVTTADGQKTEFLTSDVNSIRFEEAPVYTELNYLIGAEYGLSKDFGTYAFTIASSEPDVNGDPAEIGDIQLSLELTAETSADYLDAQLPAGYYRAGTGNEIWQLNVQKSGMWMRLDEGEDGILLCPFLAGTADVRKDADNYDIKIELSLLEGGNVALSYYGPIKFLPGVSIKEDFTEDQNITFSGAQERYYANWFYPLCDDVTLELYSGEFNSDNIQIEGYWLNLPMFMPKAENAHDPEHYLVDGVYTVEPRDEVSLYTNLPFTFQKGGTLDFWGTIHPIGTYITYVDREGRIKNAYITDGTVTVSNNGTKIEIDFVAENGIKIQGVYEGNVYVDNRNDSDTAGVTIEGTIDKDIVFDFNPEGVDMVGLSYPIGDYIKSGIYQFMVMITDYEQEHGDFLMLELSSDEEILPDGTYTINNELAPFCGLKGYLDYGGQTLFSWYGNLDDVDEFGYQNIIAPIMGGTVTITTTAENTRKLVFDLVDEDGHKLTGTYEGLFYDLPSTSPAQQAPIKTPAKAVKAPEKASLSPMRLK
ncbi:MAG: hypothetical protein HDR88_02000 [Bacteroides sp.]|nr:hypothetical protein [Bacteroides sp.]